MTPYNQYPQGSIWRKWDLHVHTPDSVRQQYGRNTDEVWEKFISDLEHLPPEIQALGINDYIFTDGYEKVLGYKKSGRLSNIKLLLPVIELRLGIFAGHSDLNKINYHIIFSNSDELGVEKIKEHFLGRLYVHPSVGWDKPIRNKSELEEFGRLLKSKMPADKAALNSDLIEGFNGLTYDLPKVEEMLSHNVFRKKNIPLFLTAIGRNEWHSMRWESAAADKRGIISSVDFIFGASQNIEEYERCKKKLIDEKVNSRIIHCSDSHYFSKRLRELEGDNKSVPENMAIGHCFTWIKSDPTFEGLRQILFEYDMRLSTSLIQPYKRNPATIIKAVRFVASGAKLPSDSVTFNPFLNSIIGGKSTGKSMLLYHIAKAIDSGEVKKVFNEMNIGDDELNKLYSFEGLGSVDFIVEWEDGSTSQLATNQEDDGNKKKILYLPQNYIERLAKPNRNKNKHSLNDYIINLVCQAPKVKERYEEFIQKVRDLENLKDAKVDNFFRLSRELKEADEKIKSIGDEGSIMKFIADLKKDLDVLKASSGLKDEQRNLYDQIQLDLEKAQVHHTILESDRRILTEFFNKVETEILSIGRQLQDTTNRISNDNVKSRFWQGIKFIKNLTQYRNKSQDRLLGKSGYLQTEIERINKRIEQLLNDRKPLDELLKGLTEVQEKEKTLANELDKIGKIQVLKKLHGSLREQRAEAAKTLIDHYETTISEYESIEHFLNENTVNKSTAGELELGVKIRYHYSKLSRTYVDVMTDNRSYKRTGKDRDISTISSSEYISKDEHVNLVKELLNDAISGDAKLKGDYKPKDAYSTILSDLFYLDWEIKYLNDTFDRMSEGKANLVVLKLLIELSDDEWPILIDQPEDQLDNRSIFSDLVAFLKQKKNTRQIIIVTHNPNLVVGADSENIIVANQKGQSREGTNEKYDFEYVSGAIEHTRNMDNNSTFILKKMGIREHICDVLEGGPEAFKKREGKYGFIPANETVK